MTAGATMLKATVTGPKRAEVVPVLRPRAVDDWVVVKVHVAPMCTEYKTFLRGGPAHFLGHEAAGEVVEVDRSSRVKVGDRVVVMPQYACGVCALCAAGDYIHCEQNLDFTAFSGQTEGHATMAQYLLKPDRLLIPIPDNMSYAHAALACCGLGATFGAVERVQPTPYDTVLITGLGPVGLGGVVNCRFRGARVISVESNPWRAQRALDLGAETVLDPADPDARAQIFALTQDRGVDYAVDCSGVPAAHRLCIDMTRRRGTVVFVGECGDETPLRISPDMLRKGLTLAGSWHYNLLAAPKLMAQIGALGSQLEQLISHRFPLTQVQQAWETQVAGRCAKVLLFPWD
jgi:L-iditol 2-dehydrogenase